MDERYVISVKADKDILGNEWRYAGVDDDSYGSGFPCWLSSDHRCKSFKNVQDAKEWFNKVKNILLSPYYNNYNLDVKTLGIRKIIVTYKKVESL